MVVSAVFVTRPVAAKRSHLQLAHIEVCGFACATHKHQSTPLCLMASSAPSSSSTPTPKAQKCVWGDQEEEEAWYKVAKDTQAALHARNTPVRKRACSASCIHILLPHKPLQVAPALQIPHILHHIWLGSKLPPAFQRLRRSWKVLHPGWQHVSSPSRPRCARIVTAGHGS